MLLGFFREGQLSTNKAPPPPKKNNNNHHLSCFCFFVCFVVVPAWSLTLCWCIAIVCALLATANFRKHFSVFLFSESEGNFFTLTTAIPQPLKSRMMFLKADVHQRRTKTNAIVFQLKKNVTSCFWKKKNVAVDFNLFVNWVCLRKAFLYV